MFFDAKGQHAVPPSDIDEWKGYRGVPDDITKAGCLVLAKRGEEAWNAWRAIYRLRWNSDAGGPVNRADFAGVDFRKHRIDFSEFQFGDDSRFVGAQFGNWASFVGAPFGAGVSFVGVQFGNHACFIGHTWSQLSGSYEDALESKRSWAEQRGLSPQAFNTISFSGARFPGSVDFSDRQFKGSTKFDRIIQDATIRRLQRDVDGRPVRDERETGFKRWMYRAYAYTSDYGASVWKPLWNLVPLPALFAALLYLFAMWGAHAELGGRALINDAKLTSAWLQFTLANMAPLPDIKPPGW